MIIAFSPLSLISRTFCVIVLRAFVVDVRCLNPNWCLCSSPFWFMKKYRRLFSNFSSAFPGIELIAIGRVVFVASAPVLSPAFGMSMIFDVFHFFGKWPIFSAVLKIFWKKPGW